MANINDLNPFNNFDDSTSNKLNYTGINKYTKYPNPTQLRPSDDDLCKQAQSQAAFQGAEMATKYASILNREVRDSPDLSAMKWDAYQRIGNYIGELQMANYLKNRGIDPDDPTGYDE